MRKFLIFILIFVSANSYSQSKQRSDHFTIKIRECFGDLNRDGIDDQVMVMMDTINPTTPLLLKIYLSQPANRSKLIIASKKIIEPQYPEDKKGKYSGHQIPFFSIKDGRLMMDSEIDAGLGNFEFKFKNGNFELIHARIVSRIGNETTSDTDFNLVTGRKTQIIENSEKILSRKIQDIYIRPLPRLQDLKYSDLNSFK